MCRGVKTWLFLACFCLPAAAGSAVAQQATATETRIVPVSVVDGDGKPVLGLTAANFRAKFRGQPAMILSVARDIGARRIVLLIDMSSSTKLWRDSSELSLQLVDQVVSRCLPGDLFTLAAFQRGTLLLSDFTPDCQAVRRQIVQERANVRTGGTALYDAIVWAAKRFSPAKAGDVIVAITDGLDNSSLRTAQEARQELARTGFRLVLVLLPATGSETDMVGRNQARKLASLSGGGTLDVENLERNPPTVDAGTDSLQELIRTVYVVEVELLRPVDEPREWKLEVVDERGQKLKNIQLTYPRLLVPLPDTAADK